MQESLAIEQIKKTKEIWQQRNASESCKYEGYPKDATTFKLITLILQND
jgi:hypothetical protein